jgi:hypothetical protein
MAQDVKLTINGNLSAGYLDNGSAGSADPGTFAVPTAHIVFGASFNADTSAVVRLNFDDSTANGLDRAYIKMSNVIKKMTKSDMVNPDIYVGLMKVNFGEETWSNHTVDNALVTNSIGGLTGVDTGIEFRQNKLPIDLPVTLGYSLSFLNGVNPLVMGTSSDENNTKGYVFKVMATMKSLPMYFSLSQYDSGRSVLGMPSLSNEALDTYALPVVVGGEYVKGYELNVRYDLLEGAQKFDPTSVPLFADAKGVFRLAYGAGAAGPMNLIADGTTMMLDAIYNVNKEYYLAFRYSSMDFDGDAFTRTSIGGGYRLSDKAILKLDYSLNAEPDTVWAPKVDNDSVALLMTVRW